MSGAFSALYSESMMILAARVCSLWIRSDDGALHYSNPCVTGYISYKMFSFFKC